MANSAGVGRPANSNWKMPRATRWLSSGTMDTKARPARPDGRHGLVARQPVQGLRRQESAAAGGARPVYGRRAKATADILSQPGTVKAAIRDSLLRYARLSVGEAGRRGCLAVAMTTELAARDADVAERTGRMFRRLQQLYAGAIVRGKASGEIAEQDEQVLARLLVSGRGHARAGQDRRARGRHARAGRPHDARSRLIFLPTLEPIGSVWRTVHVTE